MRLAAATTISAVVLLSTAAGVNVHADVGTPKRDDKPPLPVVPMQLPEADGDGVIRLLDGLGKPQATTLVPELQRALTTYLVDAHAPIAAIVVADVKTGSILAMAQGRSPQEWGAKGHSALHTGFPAASLFKTIVTTAAFEMTELDAVEPMGLTGGCAHVRESGEWLTEREPNRRDRMSLRRAFGSSCNGFYAKIAVNNLGLGIIIDFARRYGWETGVPADFAQDKSPFFPPAPGTSSTSTVGRFAAGFGRVGISAAHAAHVMLTIANDGVSKPLRLFRDSPLPSSEPTTPTTPRIFSERTAHALREILDASVKGGTASFAFRRGKYRKLYEFVGGKTGTLTGTAPKGLTSWFAGLAPVNAPEVVVASVVMLEDRWHIKAPNLAAEGLYTYFEQKSVQEKAGLSIGALPVAATGQ